MSFKFQVSIVSQEPVLFNCSVEENIAYGFNGKASLTEIENVSVSLSYKVRNSIETKAYGLHADNDD